MAQLFEENSSEIFGSRDQIRNQLIEYTKQYLELGNVDLYKTSFLSYMINVMSVLSANHLFYTSTVYRELFLIYAQLQDSVYNLAQWIGYNPQKATPATVNVVFTMPLGFRENEVNFLIPSGFQAKAGDIPPFNFLSLIPEAIHAFIPSPIFL